MALAAMISLVGLAAFALPAQAQIDLTTGVDEVNASAGLANEELTDIIGNIISAVLVFLGVIALIIIIYAGFLWMTAGGNSDQVDKAKKWMINGFIGLVIILAAYAIVNFVIEELLGSLTQ